MFARRVEGLIGMLCSPSKLFVDEVTFAGYDGSSNVPYLALFLFRIKLWRYTAAMTTLLAFSGCKFIEVCSTLHLLERIPKAISAGIRALDSR